MGKPFDKVYLEEKQDLINDLDLFKSRQKVYEDLGVAYKRGYLFYGAPGNGKSSLAYAIADHMKYDIYILDLSNMSTTNFAKAMKNVPDHSVVVIEDIDSFYNGRDPVKDNKITFSTFINTLSGVAQKNNIITVITTNRYESLDPALLRDGRCDFKLELTNPSKKTAEKFLSDIYEQPVELPDYKPVFSFAKLQGVVLQNLSDLSSAISALNYIPVYKPTVTKTVVDNTGGYGETLYWKAKD